MDLLNLNLQANKTKNMVLFSSFSKVQLFSYKYFYGLCHCGISHREQIQFCCVNISPLNSTKHIPIIPIIQKTFSKTFLTYCIHTLLLSPCTLQKMSRLDDGFGWRAPFLLTREIMAWGQPWSWFWALEKLGRRWGCLDDGWCPAHLPQCQLRFQIKISANKGC